MNVSRSTEIKVGVVSLAAIVIFVLGIILGEGITFTPTGDAIRIRLSNSGGLSNSSPVVVNGVKRGRVIDIQTDSGSVLAFIKLDDYSDLHPDAHALVSILEITGGKKVEILTGVEDGTFDIKNEMPGRTATDLGGLVTIIGDMSGELVTLVRRIDTVTSALASLMGDSVFTNDVRLMVSDGAVLVNEARQWVQTNRADLTFTVGEIRVLITDLKDAVAANDPKIRSVLDKLDLRLVDIEATIVQADSAIFKVNDLVDNVDGLVTDVRTNKGLANAILYDETFKLRMDTLNTRLQYLVEYIRQRGMNVNVGLGHQ